MVDLGFEVVDLGPADHPESGDTAPDFTRPLVHAEYWEDVALSELVADADGPTVLLCHPMAGAFPATYLWKEVTERAWHEHATVVGLSIATPYAHKRLIDERGLGGEYAIFSDPANAVADAYGISHDLDGMEGIDEPRPAAFVFEGSLTVEHAWVATEWPEFPDYDGIETAFR